MKLSKKTISKISWGKYQIPSCPVSKNHNIMAYYYVNKNAQSNGDHEVHKTGDARSAMTYLNRKEFLCWVDEALLMKSDHLKLKR